MDGIVVVDALITGFKEERFLREEALCSLLALFVHIIVHCQRGVVDEPSLGIEQEGGAVFPNLKGGNLLLNDGEGDIHSENGFRSISGLECTTQCNDLFVVECVDENL